MRKNFGSLLTSLFLLSMVGFSVVVTADTPLTPPAIQTVFPNLESSKISGACRESLKKRASAFLLDAGLRSCSNEELGLAYGFTPHSKILNNFRTLSLNFTGAYKCYACHDEAQWLRRLNDPHMAGGMVSGLRYYNQNPKHFNMMVGGGDYNIESLREELKSFISLVEEEHDLK